MAILQKKEEFSLEENQEIRSALIDIKSIVVFTYSAIGNSCDESDIDKAKTIFSGLEKIKSVNTEILDSFDWDKVFSSLDWSSLILDAINLKCIYFCDRNFCERPFKTLKKHFPHLQILKAVRINEYAGSVN